MICVLQLHIYKYLHVVFRKHFRNEKHELNEYV